MENSRPQLNLAELTQLRWLLGGVLGLLSAWTVFYMDVDALLALTALTLAVPVFTWYPRLATAAPGWLHRLAFPLIVTVFAFDWWQNREPLPAMIRLDLMLLGYRCVAPRGRREDLQLILLALFAVVVTGVFTVSIAFVVQILLFTACALALLLAITISDARAGDGPAAGAGWEQVHWGALARRLRAVSDGRVVALGAALFAGVVGLTAVFFLAIPRFEVTSSLFLDRLITRSSRTGFTDTVRFGSVTAIQKDDSMAFAVDAAPDLMPSTPYWRMIVLDEYFGEGFRMSAGLRQDFESGRERLVTHTGFRQGAPAADTWTVWYQPGVSRYLPLLGAFSLVSFSEPQGLQQSRALRLAALSGDSSKVIGYRIEGMDTSGALTDPAFERRLAGLPEEEKPDEPPRKRWRRWREMEGEPPPPPNFKELGLEMEIDRTRLAAWVDQFGGRGDGGLDLARRAARWLQEGHQYSLNSMIPDGVGDPLVRWIGSDQPGHCELFAGGLVMLARSAGVPARMVTGFKGGTWNALSGSYRVLNSDAHAWCEIWDEGLAAWVRVDPTPGAVLTEPAEVAGSAKLTLEMLPKDSGWGARMDGLRIFWYRRVVNFDSASQVSLMKTTKEVLQTQAVQARVWLEEYTQALLGWLSSPWDWKRYAGLAATAGFLTAALVFWRSLGRAWLLGWRSRRSATGRTDPVRREAAHWLRRFEAAEKAGAAGGGWEQTHAALLRLRYGERDTWAEPVQVFRDARRELRAARRAKTQA